MGERAPKTGFCFRMWEYTFKGAEAGKRLKKSFVLWKFETNTPPT